jgi:hypothetical protein
MCVCVCICMLATVTSVDVTVYVRSILPGWFLFLKKQAAGNKIRCILLMYYYFHF